ncbi:MAG: hypothetical protein RL681_205 [Candidatus Parcubacteria bacterium]
MKSDFYEKYFTTRYAPMPARDRVWKVLAAYLGRYIPEGAAVLDLGTGHGGFINHVRAKERHAVDHHKSAEISLHPDVVFARRDVSDLSNYPGNRFDVVFASNLLEHLTTDAIVKTLAEVSRILKPGGRFIVMQPNFAYAYRQYFDDYTHERIFTHVSLADLLASFGFVLRKIRPKFLPFSMRSKLAPHPLLVKLYLHSPWKPFAGQMLIVAEKPVD